MSYRMLSLQTCLIGMLLFMSTTSAETEMDYGLEAFVETLKGYENTTNDIVFLLEESGYVGESGFAQIKQLTKLILQRFPVSANQNRVAVVTFSTEAIVHINYIARPDGNNMCTALKEIEDIDYAGQYRHTIKAMEVAGAILEDARPDSEKIVILFTNGLSNSGFSPVPVANKLKWDGVIIFVIGVEFVNRVALNEVASSEDHTYVLQEFEDLPRITPYLIKDVKDDSLDLVEDSSLCSEQCAKQASCYCDIRTGKSQCICNAGYFDGKDEGGEKNCIKCPRGAYKAEPEQTDCTPCPVHSTTALEGSTSPSDCICQAGYEKFGNICFLCPEGMYKDKASNTNCSKCPRNSITFRKGTTRISDCLCSPGFEKSGPFCTLCPKGTYKNKASNTNCSKCPTDSTTAHVGSTKFSDCTCEADFVRIGNSCIRASNQTEIQPEKSEVISTIPIPQVPNTTPITEEKGCESPLTSLAKLDEVDAGMPLLAKLIRSLPSNRRMPKIIELLNNVYHSAEKQ